MPDNQLLFTDHLQSVIGSVSTQWLFGSYSPFGNIAPATLLHPRFNGQYSDPVTGHYILGNGYRVYSPCLRKFFSPDNMSPFGPGGINTYAYCNSDPVNRSDPTGHFLERAGLLHAISEFHRELTKNRGIAKAMFGQRINRRALEQLSHTASIERQLPKTKAEWITLTSRHIKMKRMQKTIISQPQSRHLSSQITSLEDGLFVLNMTPDVPSILTLTDPLIFGGTPSQVSTSLNVLGTVIPGIASMAIDDIFRLRRIGLKMDRNLMTDKLSGEILKNQLDADKLFMELIRR